MATLDNKSIKKTLSAVVKYNNNPDKNRPTDGLFAAAAYIRGEHSVERLYSRGHNGCSGNPELALEQFNACEDLYYKKKGGAREAGLAEGKRPIIAEHLFMSFPPEEEVSYDTQCEIADKLCASPLLKDFYAISNRHYNTDNDHSHILVSNYSKDGSRKLSMNKTKRNELRKELDRICVSYGLSIIDDPALRRNDPEREQFVRDLVCNSTVNIYAPADYERVYNKSREFDRWMLEQIRAGRVKVADDVSKNRAWDEQQERYRSLTQEEAYRKWIAQQELIIRDKEKKAADQRLYVYLKEEDKKKKKARRIYYWDDRYRSSKYPDCTYAVRRYDNRGYRKPFINIIIELTFSVSINEENYYKERNPNAKPRTAYFGPPAKEAQALMDSLRYMRDQNIQTPIELDDRIGQVGRELSEVRKGLAYYKKTVENCKDIDDAITAFIQMETTKKMNGSLTEEEQMIFNEAYRIMAANHCTTLPDRLDLSKRMDYAKKKVNQLQEHEKRLKKDYHDLKFIESHNSDIQNRIEYYTYRNQDSHSLNDLISRAQPEKTDRQTDYDKNYENFQKKY